MTDMIERVARVICASSGLNPDIRVTAGDGYLWETYRSTARAAISAMREPTTEMLDAAAAAHPRGYGRETTLTSIIEREWRVMIDAALEDITKTD